MANALLNFHFDFLHPSLTKYICLQANARHMQVKGGTWVNLEDIMSNCQLGGNSVNIGSHKLCNHSIPECKMEHGRHDMTSFHLLGGDGDIFMVNSE